ncbi:hypothetical protein QBC37DRAFT_454802 [Rhypophila decipiens]|uniref:Uncharacterized protein n=1 Tax=Rhypophila decipiens TaxID=261697 RepID=A0AAN7B015_9PEZI|nr:hypothetical protein QBC37DRAFT_454802 [Rhypophila decipiens]
MNYPLAFNDDTNAGIQRKKFWTHVFQDRDTLSGAGQAPKLPARSSDSATLVGHLNQDLPMSPRKQRKVIGTHSRTPSEATANARKHLSKVFPNPSLNIDTNTVSFLWTDSKGSLISAQYVMLPPGLDMVHAKSRAIRHWDSKETARIWRFNLDTCIYWARCRLLRSIYLEAVQNAMADQVPHAEDFSKLVTLATCAGVLQRAAEIVHAMQQEIRQATTNPCWL